MDFVIIWSRKAQQDRKIIFGYWNKRNGSKSYSFKLNQQIRKSLKNIQSLPFAGSPTNVPLLRYVIIENNYKVYYRIQGNRILIVSVWDVRQDPRAFNP